MVFGKQPGRMVPEERNSGQERSTVHSLVQVYFPERGMAFSYYNDLFDLCCGDIVYVEGKMAGLRGRVVAVSHTFKIRLSDYKRVISLADTDVAGTFHMAGSHFLWFDREQLETERVRNWFKPPEKMEEYVIGRDGSGFPLDRMLDELSYERETLEKGKEIFLKNQVVYLVIDRGEGVAIVQQDEAIEVEFEFRNGMIHNLVCECFEMGICRHKLGALFQLRELLAKVVHDYLDTYEKTGYFAAMSKKEFFMFVVDGKSGGSFRM